MESDVNQKNRMSVNDQSAINACTSCQMCGAVCAHNAIEIRLNEDGFYRPFVDESKCIECGLCTKVCYKFDEDVHVTSPEREEQIEAHSAQNVSDELLKKVTSGGVADAIAKELISQGYVCIGVVYNNSRHRAEHRVATTIAETNAFRGSKYIQAYSMDAMKHLVKNARTTKFAVFGLPCHIYAVNKFLTTRKLRDNCVLVDLFCHGCPSMLVWNKYEQSIRQRLSDKTFDDVLFRSKPHGWGAFYVVVVVDGKPVYACNPPNDNFYDLFFSDQVLNDSCSNCQLRSTMEYTDIRLGDYWSKRFLGDKKGVSAVALVSERSKAVFSAIKGSFYTTLGSMTEVKAKQSYGKKYNPNLAIRKQMLDALRDENRTIEDVVRIYESNQGIGYKAKKILKYIDWHMPFDLVRFLKRFA